MPDSNGADQDGATEPITKARFDGLMSAYQKTLAEKAELEARQTAQPAAQAPSQPQYDPEALYEYDLETGFKPYTAPTPRRLGQRRDLPYQPKDDESPGGSPESCDAGVQSSEDDVALILDQRRFGARSLVPKGHPTSHG